jgi:hypothetical protein
MQNLTYHRQGQSTLCAAMNPLTRTQFAIHNTAKVNRLEAAVERMADVLALIHSLSDTWDTSPFTSEETLAEIARLARSALVSATPAAPRLATN